MKIKEGVNDNGPYAEKIRSWEELFNVVFSYFDLMTQSVDVHLRLD